MAIVRNQHDEPPKEIIILSSSDEESTSVKTSSNSVIKPLSDDQTYNNNKIKEVTNDYPQILHSFTLKNTESIHSIPSKTSEETQNKADSDVQDTSSIKNVNSSSNVGEISNSSKHSNIPRTSGSSKKFFSKHETSSSIVSRFKKFLELCRCSMNDIDESEREKIINKLRKRYNSANPLFISSKNFYSFVDKKIEDVVNDYKNIYVHIEEVYTELKGFSCKRHKNSSETSAPKNETSAKIGESNTSKENDATVNSVESNLLRTNQFKEEKTGESRVNNTIQTIEHKPNSKHIKRLEILLKKIHHKIKSLQQKELSLDDMDDPESIYIQEDRFVKRFNKVWKKICVLTGRTTKTGRQTERRFCFNGSRYPEINSKVERFINKKKIFPDYKDILNIVMSVNDVLKFSNNQAQSVAREVFEEVGKLLQKRRLQDNRDLMGCFLTDDVDLNNDPAWENEDLKNRLEESSKIASKNLEELMESYVLKQVEQKLEPEEVDDNADLSPSHSSRHDDDEEEEDAEEEEPEELSDIDLIEDMLNNDEESSKNVREVISKEMTSEDHTSANLNDDDNEWIAKPQLQPTSSSYNRDVSKCSTESFLQKRKIKSERTDSSNKKLCLNNGENKEKYEEIIILE
ncbi:death domain-associated protein 6-like isoform X1 [Centruroides vittatus]|uniref:death domain-associated protein 6-like isoform X1 n=1 Tax=Centruroides vittatus TaxID=120091 RepID=UPI00350EDA08